MTQHNAALVEQTNAAIEQTEAQASELDRIVDVFNMDDDDTVVAGPAPRPAMRRQPALRSVGNAAIAPDWNEF
jgi:methyl-accepting chemotaxis protein